MSAKTYLDFEEYFSVGRPRVDKLKAIGDSYADSSDPGACQAFSEQVGNVESFIKETYGIAMLIARKEEDPHKIASILRQMSEFCDLAMNLLSGLKEKYPVCGTHELYDLALDYKLACDQRYNNILSELECPTQNLPEGLFPSLK